MENPLIYTAPCYSPVGDCAMLIELGHGIDVELNDLVLRLEQQILSLEINGIEETTPSYAALMLHYNPDQIAFRDLQSIVSTIDLERCVDDQPRFLWHVPVCYGGDYGEDLDMLANYHHISSDEIIERHCRVTYRVYMTGFAPGFTYLGGLDPHLHTPRRDNPRLKTPAGSISIGGMQALIAGVEMPSGWRLLGRTPAQTYMAHRSPHFLINAGDSVRFHELEHHRFSELQAAAFAGEWSPEKEAHV